MVERRCVIEWRPKARDDLAAIVQFIAQDDVRRAEAFAHTLSEKTKVLALQPEIGRKGRPGLPNNVRELVLHPNYIVFYRVRADVRTVEILRVKHAAQRMP